MIRPMPRAMSGWLARWLERHRSAVSFWLHAVGIPLTILAGAMAICQLVHGRWDLWWRPVVLVIAGYLLQFVGHVYEGNDMGEVIFIKRLLGLPYVAVSPRYAREQSRAPQRSPADTTSGVG